MAVLARSITPVPFPVAPLLAVAARATVLTIAVLPGLGLPVLTTLLRLLVLMLSLPGTLIRSMGVPVGGLLPVVSGLATLRLPVIVDPSDLVLASPVVIPLPVAGTATGASVVPPAWLVPWTLPAILWRPALQSSPL